MHRYGAFAPAPLAHGVWRYSLAALLLLAASARLLSAQSPPPEKSPSPEVLKLRVRGVRHVDHHDLLKSISTQASREAQSANVVASNIQHIFAVTEQTGDGTRSTAQIVRELSRTAEELRQSVTRFKIA